MTFQSIASYLSPNGNQPNWKEITYFKTNANQKIGIADPKSANKRITWSSHLLCLIEENIPNGIAVPTATINANIESSKVAANFSLKASETG